MVQQNTEPVEGETAPAGAQPTPAHDVGIGGGLGAVGGAAIGMLAGGPLGAVVGAIVGGVVAAGAVEVVEQQERDDDVPVDGPAVIAEDTPSMEVAPSVTVFSAALLDLIPRIRERAYEIYDHNGRSDGRALEDWLEAERETRAAAPA